MIQRYSIGINVEKCDDANFCYYDEALTALAEKEREIDRLKGLLLEAVAVYEDYIKVLLEEINSLVGLAHVHGWKSERVEQGKACREKISILKEKAGKP